MTRAGTIILVDGMAGAGGSTLLSGMPKPLACLDTDVDGWQWLREQCAEPREKYYVPCRNIVKARSTLDAWSKDTHLASIVVDDYSFFWQLICQHVLDDEARKREYNTSNVYRAWGPAKQTMRRLRDTFIRAKENGKHVGLRAHSKRDTKQVGKEIVDLGEKWDCEQPLANDLNACFRMKFDKQTHRRWLEVVKCRAQYNYRPVYDLGQEIDVPQYESHLMHARIIEKFGAIPASNGVSAGAEDEDTSALAAMESAAQPRGGK